MATQMCQVVFFRPIPAEPGGPPAVRHAYAVWADPWDLPGSGIATIVTQSSDSPLPETLQVPVREGGPTAALVEARRILAGLPGNRGLEVWSDCPAG